MEIIIIPGFLGFALLLYFVYKRFKSCIIVFENERFIVPLKDRNCPVMDFDSKGTYRKDNNGNWYPESRFTLAEWSWADRFNTKYFMNKFVKVYLNIFKDSFYVFIISLYFGIVFFLGIFPDKLEESLSLIFIFWLGLLFSAIFKELLSKKKEQLV